MAQNSIEEIKNRLDIVEVLGSYIKLKKAGANYRALCPFHSEKTPSFFVSPARQIWHCFGCGLGGDIFGFIKQIEGLEFGDALRILAKRAGVELKREDPKIRSQRQRHYEVCELACRFFQKQLLASQKGKQAQDYLLNRGLTKESIKKWRLGYAPDNWQALSDFLVSRGYKREEALSAGLAIRSEKKQKYFDRFRARIMFPVFDLSSQVIGFGGRIFQSEDPAKYLNTPNTQLYDKSRVLYGLDKAKLDIRKKDGCIMVEGYVDVILSHQTNVKNIVAVSGTALSVFQLGILKRYSANLFTAFDMDSAGNAATKRGIDLALAKGFNIKVVPLPQKKDPADVISENPENWQKALAEAQSILDFYFQNVLLAFNPQTAEGRKEISAQLLPIIRRIPNKIEQSFWTQKLADVLQVKELAVFEELKKIKTSGQTTKAPAGPKPASKSRRELLEERLIGLALRSADCLSLLKQNDFNFFSCRSCEVLGYLNSFCKNEKHPSSGQGVWISKDNLNMPLELNKFLTNVLLSSSAEQEEDINREFSDCLRQIRSFGIKKRLGRISNDIKTAEAEKNFIKTKELLQEFNNYSKKLCSLES